MLAKATNDGDFPNHDATPLKTETLKDLQAFIRANPGKYAFDMAFDGDADREHCSERDLV